MKQAFCYLLRVRYGECDAQKVVFNARYLDYVDIAVTEFTRAIWGDYNSILSQGIDNQVVNFNIDWFAPAKFDDVLAAYVEAVKIGNSSYTLQLDFCHYCSQASVAKAQITYVMVDAATHKKMQIPEKLRRQLESGAAGLKVDHAGAAQQSPPPDQIRRL